MTTFLERIGQPHDTAKLKHFAAVTIDQREGRLAGISDAAQRILGLPPVIVEEFINQHRSLFDSAARRRSRARTT
jgi:NAD(P)H dehydrogenase (quinone)